MQSIMLYFALVRSKLKYSSTAWNSLTSTDTITPERLPSLCYNSFCCHKYENALEHLEFHAL